jgi:DNA repair protein RecO (recombination protein O)
MIETSEAIILNSRKFNESSKIITLFSKDFGKFSAIAKGAMSAKSKFGNLLEPANYLQITFYKKPQDQLQLLTNAEVNENFWNIRNNFQSMMVAYSHLETVIKLLEDFYVNKNMFEYLVENLQKLNKIGNNQVNLLISFLYYFIKQQGLSFDLENIPKSSQKSIYFNYEDGTFSENKEGFNIVEIYPNTMLKFITIINDNLSYNYIELTNNELIILLNLFNRYISRHLDRTIFWESIRMYL